MLLIQIRTTRAEELEEPWEPIKKAQVRNSKEVKELEMALLETFS